MLQDDGREPKKKQNTNHPENQCGVLVLYTIHEVELKIEDTGSSIRRVTINHAWKALFCQQRHR